MAYTLILTCEHGGNAIPKAYARLFAPHQRLLASHRGWDSGALEMAQCLARTLHAPLHAATTSRLLVDLNRSLHHRRLFSSITESLPPAERQRIVARYYAPHRHAVQAAISALQGPVLHVAVHSFTPVLAGMRRRADIGLLYDPQRLPERRLARRWQALLRAADDAKSGPPWRVRCNHPYRGASDGFTTALRRCFGPTRYVGIELEINQRHVAVRRRWERMQAWVAASLQTLLRG